VLTLRFLSTPVQNLKTKDTPGGEISQAPAAHIVHPSS